MKTIGIIGTRRRNTEEDFLQIEKIFLKYYNDGDIICSGLCSFGADRFAVELQKKYNTNYIWHSADWRKHNKIAGFIRNDYIARDSDILIARVHPDRTGGTEDTIKKFLRIKDPLNLILVYDKTPLEELF